MNLSTMKNAKELLYFQSMLAFELIGVAATLAGCCVAGIAIFKQQPLAVLVAAFTMFFSGMFMLVGHSMMLSIHTSKNNNNESSGGGWHHGWSFIVAWLAFGLCLVAGVINCIVYRNFRKMSEELTGTPSRVKYANRPHPPVNLGSSI
ncbi:lens fiber membrane intrinsic protein-like isoform X2 [Asterias rubens]|uniref:lens fiber membrane intrinsic protein-like isoform X2 n=1 Tax=Asterias rubens TaxID=7604 RepID=UPI001454E850|nr:lens fiber membrane intrinsic protein-like isoform X2 [Asterias rubens]